MTHTLAYAPPRFSQLPFRAIARSDAAENSIMQTITIAASAILIAAGLVTAPGLINNARDNNATTDLANVAYVQAAVSATTSDFWAYDNFPTSTYHALEAPDSSIKLTPSGYSAGGKGRLLVDAAGDQWVAVAKSASGRIFLRTSEGSHTVEVTQAVVDSFGFANQMVGTPASFGAARVGAMVDAVKGDYAYDFSVAGTVRTSPNGEGTGDASVVTTPTTPPSTAPTTPPSTEPSSPPVTTQPTAPPVTTKPGDCDSTTSATPFTLGYKTESIKTTVCRANGTTAFAYGYAADGSSPILEDTTAKESPRLYIATKAETAKSRLQASFTFHSVGGANSTGPTTIRFGTVTLTNTMNSKKAVVTCTTTSTALLTDGQTGTFDCTAPISVTTDWAEWQWNVIEYSKHGGTKEDKTSIAPATFNTMASQ